MNDKRRTGSAPSQGPAQRFEPLHSVAERVVRRVDKMRNADAAIGARVRARRTQLGISQEALGYQLGVTGQQIQKYESGANRISGATFLELADALECRIEWFFEAAATTRGSDQSHSQCSKG